MTKEEDAKLWNKLNTLLKILGFELEDTDKQQLDEFTSQYTLTYVKNTLTYVKKGCDIKVTLEDIDEWRKPPLEGEEE